MTMASKVKIDWDRAAVEAALARNEKSAYYGRKVKQADKRKGKGN